MNTSNINVDYTFYVYKCLKLNFLAFAVCLILYMNFYCIYYLFISSISRIWFLILSCFWKMVICLSLFNFICEIYTKERMNILNLCVKYILKNGWIFLVRFHTSSTNDNIVFLNIITVLFPITDRDSNCYIKSTRNKF